MFATAAVVLSVPSAGLASSSPAAAWSQLAPATSPGPRYSTSMTYDPATGNVVLFGGVNRRELNTTWTWNGATWTKLAPAASPPVRWGASMVYDPATGNIVMFGGEGPHGVLDGTWTWNGTTWTNQAPATSPHARYVASMDYDPATGNVVLFGGYDEGALGDTWTWGSSS